MKEKVLNYSHPSGPVVRDIPMEQMTRRGHPNILKRVQKSRSSGCAKPSISDAEDETSAGSLIHSILFIIFLNFF